ncbi:TetR/AcrR family transcriptional regulator [Pseudonocardia spinosispora]|uniref:TetR/AcrR family transcriptional regulator n=1 Tax=Pseudonocardia spinosispora TaxID=103441 RepID=UPI00042869E6|nr:TetR/AcrR family transcriptional regulator [Pseudonocardia spinosispora]
MATQEPLVGRRERKKAATRKAIADAALRLFLEHGYDKVTMREVAEEADVSATTLLNYFPTKETLVFDHDADVQASLVAAITDRPAGTSAVTALHQHLKERAVHASAAPGATRFRVLVQSEAALTKHERDMWLRHQDALTAAVAEAEHLPSDDRTCRLVAAFALQTLIVAMDSDDPSSTIDLGFALIEHGRRAG